MKRTLSARWLELLLLAFFLVGNLAWIARDTRPWRVWDCYSSAIHVMQALGQDPSHPVHGIGAFLSTISDAGRPPLYQLCTVPFVTLFGFSEDAFLVVNLALMAVLFIAMFQMGVEAHGRLAGFVAAIATVSFAPTVHFLHQYRAYNGAFAGIAVTLWALMALINRRRIWTAWAAAVAATAAIMMHPVASYVLLVPMATTWIWMFLRPEVPTGNHQPSSITNSHRSKLRTPLFLKGLLPSAGIPLLITLLWYGLFGGYLLRYFDELHSSWLAAYRGATRVTWTFKEIPADWLWMAKTSVYHITSVLALLTISFSLVLLFKGETRERFVVGWLVAAYLAVAMIPRELSWQYGAFALPLFGVILGLGAVSFAKRRTRYAFATMVIAASALSFSMMTLGAPKLPTVVQRYLGMSGRGGLTLYRNPPVTAYYPIDDALNVIIGSEKPGEVRRTAALFAGPPEFAKAAHFRLLRFHPDKCFRLTGVTSPVFGHPFPFRALMKSRWLVYLTKPANWNIYRRALARLFETPSPIVADSYKRVQTFPWPGGRRLVIYRRTRAVSVNEIDLVVKTLSLPPRFVTTSSLVAADILEHENRRDEAIRRLLQAARIDNQPPLIRAKILARAAQLLLETGNTREAERRARQALSIVPWNATARHVLINLQRHPSSD